MLRVVAAVVCGAALATGAAAVAAAPGAEGSDWAAAALSSSKAGARPVSVLVSLHTELQCGRLRGRSIALTFPAASRLPKTVAAGSVAVQGKRPSGVTLRGRTLSIALAPPAGVICDVIGPGVAKILVTRAARIGNPSSAGTYTLTVRYGAETLPATLTIR